MLILVALVLPSAAPLLGMFCFGNLMRECGVVSRLSDTAQNALINITTIFLGLSVGSKLAADKFLDPKNGPLIAVKLHVLTRKTLGGLQTNLDSQMIGADGQLVPGLFAADEVAGVGGGGYHGYNALEGTFLGGCIFSGRNAGRSRAVA